ncbi:MAG: UDP-N-acetylmuramoyl-L-alanine--D-glutamate ligase [Canibacter sp.]
MGSKSAARVESLTSWHDDWSDLRVAVLGLGVTGFSVADTLVELGARVRVIAGAPDAEREQLLQIIGSEYVVLPDDQEQLTDLRGFDPELVVVSPGYRPDHLLTQWALSEGIPVWGDIDLGWRLRDKTRSVADWICVTGTNGKTTTSQLLAHMLVTAGYRSAPVGNIGTPILDALRDPEGFDVLVVELSSFQLERLQHIEPYASVCLNIADDHIDWHGSAEGYRAAKAKVYENTRIACVYNRADEVTLRMVENAEVQEGARAVSFGLDVPPRSGAGVVEDILADRTFNEDRATAALELLTLDELREQGIAQPHMIQNILAATALARSYGVAPEEIAGAVLNFTPDAHRAEVVAVENGIFWIDDSKATNVHAANAALNAHKSVIWVLGGLLKGVDIRDLVAKHRDRLRAAVVIGSDREPVLDALRVAAPGVAVSEITATDGDEVMIQAVKAAAQFAVSGDAVLLSPAAASMDQFESFNDRGDRFAAAVRTVLRLSS